MTTTTPDSLLEFLKFWNNGHLSNEENTVPVNMYNIAALSAGVGFTLKWFITKDDFDRIARGVNYIFGDDKTRMLLVAGEDRIELEIDKHNIITGFKSEVRDIDATIQKIAKNKTY